MDKNSRKIAEDAVEADGLTDDREPIHLQRFHLIPSHRALICLHEHEPYSGSIPCTGPKVCSMCGRKS